MHHEMAGPESRMIGIREASELAMPGQLRISKEIALRKHIAQFYNGPEWQKAVEEGYREVDAEKKRNDEYAAAIGMSYHESLQLPSGVQHLLRALHEANNDGAAYEIAHKTELTQEDPIVHRLMVASTAIILYESRKGIGLDKESLLAHVGISADELMPVMKEIARTNADWPIPKKTWEQTLQRELRGLRYVGKK